MRHSIQEENGHIGRLLSEHSFVYPYRALREAQLSEHSLLATCALQVRQKRAIAVYYYSRAELSAGL